MRCDVCGEAMKTHSPETWAKCDRESRIREIYSEVSDKMIWAGAIQRHTLNATFRNSDPKKEPEFIKEIHGFLKSNYRSGYWWGDCGRGKTFLSKCVLNQVMRFGKWACQTTGAELASTYRRFPEHPLRLHLEESTVLLIDDIGYGDWDHRSIEGLWSLINARERPKRKLLVTCNFDLPWLRNMITNASNGGYAESIIQRLHPIQVLHFEGESLR